MSSWQPSSRKSSSAIRCWSAPKRRRQLTIPRPPVHREAQEAASGDGEFEVAEADPVEGDWSRTTLETDQATLAADLGNGIENAFDDDRGGAPRETPADAATSFDAAGLPQPPGLAPSAAAAMATGRRPIWRPMSPPSSTCTIILPRSLPWRAQSDRPDDRTCADRRHRRAGYFSDKTEEVANVSAPRSNASKRFSRSFILSSPLASARAISLNVLPIN